MEELKEHYKSDWHRYNLKRKVAGLPVVGNDLFQRVMQQANAAAAATKETGRSHLKRPSLDPKSVAKAKRVETWIEHHKDEIELAQGEARERERRWRAGEAMDDEDEDEDTGDEDHDKFDEEDGSDDGWESMDGDEAREVLARMDRMAMDDTRDTRGGDDQSEESDDDESDGDGMELDLTNAPVRLAENGYELIITRDDGTQKRVGPRELRRYYKQRHKPDDDRATLLANAANNKERGLVRLGETRDGERGLKKFDLHGKFVGLNISIMVKRAQKASRKYERNNLFQGNSSIKKFDLNGQNVKIKLPKACPY